MDPRSARFSNLWLLALIATLAVPAGQAQDPGPAADGPSCPETFTSTAGQTFHLASDDGSAERAWGLACRYEASDQSFEMEVRFEQAPGPQPHLGCYRPVRDTELTAGDVHAYVSWSAEGVGGIETLAQDLLQQAASVAIACIQIDLCPDRATIEADGQGGEMGLARAVGPYTSDDRATQVHEVSCTYVRYEQGGGSEFRRTSTFLARWVEADAASYWPCQAGEPPRSTEVASDTRGASTAVHVETVSEGVSFDVEPSESQRAHAERLLVETEARAAGCDGSPPGEGSAMTEGTADGSDQAGEGNSTQASTGAATDTGRSTAPEEPSDQDATSQDQDTGTAPQGPDAESGGIPLWSIGALTAAGLGAIWWFRGRQPPGYQAPPGYQGGHPPPTPPPPGHQGPGGPPEQDR